MSQQQGRRRNRLLPALVLGGGSWYLLQNFTGPLVVGALINPLAVLPALFVVMSVAGVAEDFFWWLGNAVDRLSALTATGLKGTAGFIESLDEIRHDLIEEDWGPYWGMFKGEEIIAEVGSNSTIFGPTGTGKGVTMVQTNIMTIPGSKLISDFKSENACITARVLRERGENVRILNIGDVNTEILGKTDYYNPLVLIADLFLTEGGLRDVSEDTDEMCKQLDRDPVEYGGANNEEYWKNGSRNLIGFGIQDSVLVKGHNATLGDVSALLQDKNALLKSALWACGRLEQSEEGAGLREMPIEESPWISIHPQQHIDNYIKYYRETAIGIADLLADGDSRVYGPFLSGAQQALKGYNVSTRAHEITKKTTFRFGEMKESVTTVFIVPDVTKLKAQKPVLELFQYCFGQEMKRHKAKHVLVHIIADEAGNQEINDLDEEVTWSRGGGLRYQIYGQNIPALRKKYGKDAVESIQSESEIVLFLPGQKDIETIDMIKKKMGERSQIAMGRSGDVQSPDFEIGGADYREDGRPLMYGHEIRTTDKGILFLRSNRPILVDLPPIAAIEPFRSQIDINPYHGKPYLLPVVLKLNRDAKNNVRGWWRKALRFFKPRKREFDEKKRFLARLARLSWFTSGMFRLWPLPLIVAFFFASSSPHVLVNYQYRQHTSGAKSFISCTYFGVHGFVTPIEAGDCPWIVMLEKHMAGR